MISENSLLWLIRNLVSSKEAKNTSQRVFRANYKYCSRDCSFQSFLKVLESSGTERINVDCSIVDTSRPSTLLDKSL